MPKVHFVKSAIKADKDHNIKKGDSYFWWKFYRGGKCVSKTKPKPSQLTRSTFWSTYYSIIESISDTPELSDCESDRDAIIDDLQNLIEETQSSLDNMPYQLQEAETGQMMQERIDSIEGIISELQSVDCTDEELSDEEKTLKADDIWGEITGILDNISCS